MVEVATIDRRNTAGCCRGCGAADVLPFFETHGVPVDVGTLATSVEEARQVPCGDIQLVFCPHCELIHNARFDASLVSFRPGYEVALVYSPVFRNYIAGVAERLVQRYQLRGKSVFEIGCGGGDFLRILGRHGVRHGIGVDPTVPQSTTERIGDSTIDLVPGCFSAEHADRLGDFVCCLSVFEAIPEPLHFLQQFRQMIGGRPIPCYFEVFNGYRSIQQGEVWSIHYEQCNYFSLSALASLFDRSGFCVREAGPCYEGNQYLFVEAEPASHAPTPPRSGPADGVPAAVAEFGMRFEEQLALWNERLTAWRREGRVVAVWGSGGKGIMFLNSVSQADAVSCVVDINPKRQHRFIPGTGQRVVPPESLRDLRPQTVILTNALYEREIVGTLRELGVDCELMVA